MALFKCEIEYKALPHLMQIYTGFFELSKLGIIDLKIKKAKKTDDNIPVINVLLNNKIKVIYDTMDGMTWLSRSREENIAFFKDNFKNIDFYFKRSYHKQLTENSPSNCKVFPLGFNYNIQPKENLLFLNDGLKNKIKYLIKSNSILKKVSNKNFYYTEDFEHYPIKNKEEKILFLTRVWNPNETSLESNKEHRKKINEIRVACIQACRDKYGENFTGGLWVDDYSYKNYNSFTLPNSLTSKKSFLNALKEHSICISTTGLHDSIGWKFGEYVAASRAIVSEPLLYDVPGNFEINKNYFQFEDEVQLLSSIDMLLQNRDVLYKTMLNNFHYYNVYLNPKNLVLNSLITIINNEEFI